MVDPIQPPCTRDTHTGRMWVSGQETKLQCMHEAQRCEPLYINMPSAGGELLSHAPSPPAAPTLNLRILHVTQCLLPDEVLRIDLIEGIDIQIFFSRSSRHTEPNSFCNCNYSTGRGTLPEREATKKGRKKD